MCIALPGLFAVFAMCRDTIMELLVKRELRSVRLKEFDFFSPSLVCSANRMECLPAGTCNCAIFEQSEVPIRRPQPPVGERGSVRLSACSVVKVASRFGRRCAATDRVILTEPAWIPAYAGMTGRGWGWGLVLRDAMLHIALQHEGRDTRSLPQPHFLMVRRRQALSRTMGHRMNPHVDISKQPPALRFVGRQNKSPHPPIIPAQAGVHMAVCLFSGRDEYAVGR